MLVTGESALTIKVPCFLQGPLYPRNCISRGVLAEAMLAEQVLQAVDNVLLRCDSSVHGGWDCYGGDFAYSLQFLDT